LKASRRKPANYVGCIRLFNTTSPILRPTVLVTDNADSDQLIFVVNGVNQNEWKFPQQYSPMSWADTLTQTRAIK